jgi:hypothetical protein
VKKGREAKGREGEAGGGEGEGGGGEGGLEMRVQLRQGTKFT